MKTILIVDDEPMIRNLYTDILEREGFRAVMAEDGDVGFKQLEAENPDVVLLDLMMDKVNGFEMLAKMRADARFKDTPVVVVTARAPKDLSSDQRQSLKGVKAFLTKGQFKLEGLINLVRELVESPNGQRTKVWPG